MESKLISPFRYPGAKANLAQYIKAFTHENMLVGTTFVELFAGGASASLEMLNSGLVSRVVLVERDPLVAAFWMCIRKDPSRFSDMIYKTKLNLGLWKRLRKNLNCTSITRENLFELGYAGLILNRTCFSGIISAGPIGGMEQNSEYSIDCRFNSDELISRIQKIGKHRKQIDVICGDSLQLLKRRKFDDPEQFFLYVDPPYFQMGHRLYRHAFNEADHTELADLLSQTTTPWLLSYDNHKFIRDLYKAHHNRRVSLAYSIKQSRRERELLVSNMYLPKPVYGKLESRKSSVSL